MKTKTTKFQEPQKVPFKEYYESLSKEEKHKFMRRIYNRLQVTHSSVYRWLNGKTKPQYPAATIIAEIADKPVTELFPHLNIN